MNFIDFIIGLTLMNALPHFVLGVWKGRMLSGLGIGNRQNILYSWFNFALSLGLFLYFYGPAGLLEHGIYAGAMFTLVMYYLLGKFFYTTYHKNHYKNTDPISAQ